MASTGLLLDERIPAQDNQPGPSASDDLPPSYEPSTAQPFRAEDYVKDGKKHVILAASGSVATIKLPEIIKRLESSTEISIRIVLTDAATRFLSGMSEEQPSVASLRQYPHVEGLYIDADEWSEPWVRGNPILHIELRKWVDFMIVAPLDANTLAKMANGISDNLLTSVMRAWDGEGEYNPAGREGRPKYLIAAPAMNTAMWNHPATKKHIKILEDEWAEARKLKKGPSHNYEDGSSRYSITVVPWAKILRPIGKELACGDSGVGAMVSVESIVREVLYQAKKYD